jgi:iron complex transport system ATP-binding protein
MRLTARDLSIGYGDRVVGSGISLTVLPGEVLCLLGPNGAGKTTLFRTLLGQPPLAGTVAIDGVKLEFLKPYDIAQRLAYVPQAQVTEFSYSVLDIVLMGRTARLRSFASPGSEDRRTALDKLKSLGIGELAFEDYTQISGGQRQLVLIARALTHGAPFLVMDEPTASLDFGNQAMVLARIRELAAEGCGIVLSTHDPARADGRNPRRHHRRGRPQSSRQDPRDRDGRGAVGAVPHRGRGRGDAVRPPGLRPAMAAPRPSAAGQADLTVPRVTRGPEVRLPMECSERLQSFGTCSGPTETRITCACRS